MRPPLPRWVSIGERNHQRFRILEQKRNLSRYGLDTAEREFEVWLSSECLSLHGRADLILIGLQTISVVEFKSSLAEVRRSHLLQLVAYSIMAEEKYKKKSKVGFLVSTQKDQLKEVKIDEKLRSDVIDIRKRLEASVTSVEVPDSPASGFQCKQCEFLNFCNDRD